MLEGLSRRADSAESARVQDRDEVEAVRSSHESQFKQLQESHATLKASSDATREQLDQTLSELANSARKDAERCPGLVAFITPQSPTRRCHRAAPQCLRSSLCVFALAGRCQGLESLLCFVSVRNSLHKGLYLSGRLLCILGGLGAHRSRVHHACVGSEPNIHGIFIDLRSG